MNDMICLTLFVSCGVLKSTMQTMLHQECSVSKVSWKINGEAGWQEECMKKYTLSYALNGIMKWSVFISKFKLFIATIYYSRNYDLKYFITNPMS